MFHNSFFKHCFALISLISSLSIGYTQDIEYVRSIVDTLASPGMHGRGYVSRGDRVAAQFIAGEYDDIGLKHFKDDYYQPFEFTVNTFPGELTLEFDNRKLIPGKDYLLTPGSMKVKGTFPVIILTSETLINEDKMNAFRNSKFSKSFILVDARTAVNEGDEEFFKTVKANHLRAKGIIWLSDKKLTYSVSREASSVATFEVTPEAVADGFPKEVTVNVEQELEHNYPTQNVIGYIKGRQEPDSFIVYTAHYDHLGRMGSATYFPGANDNASGVAMLLDLAKHYKKNPPAYSIVFMCFAGEEAGLIGSRYYTENPLFPLKKIKFLINLDLMGNGDGGITAVNGKVFTQAFDKLVSINDEKGLLVRVKARGKAANSDHHFFTEKGVSCFFIYSEGKHKAYHDIEDTAENLPLIEYEDLFRLINEFASSFEKK